MDVKWRVWSVRGAVTLATDDKQEMVDRIGQLLTELVHKNGMNYDGIINIHFSQTTDIDFLNAAQAARSGSMGELTSRVPLFCSTEPHCPQSLPRTIRVIMSYYQHHDHQSKPVYLFEARQLRKDLFNA